MEDSYDQILENIEPLAKKDVIKAEIVIYVIELKN